MTLLWNLQDAPDTQYDEVVYSRAGQAVAAGWDLTWTNRPVFVHPPVSFLVQAGWLRLLDRVDVPLLEVISATRLLAAVVSVANVVLLALLVRRLAPAAAPGRRDLLTVVVAVLAALDPLLLRYGRMALIEPFALLGCLVTLHLALRLQERRAAVYVLAVGLSSGLTLLTKEVTFFLLLSPLVAAVLGRDRTLRRKAVGALLTGLALWLVFPLWAAQLGLLPSFVDIKTSSLERLAGSLQTTGWNVPGASFVSALGDQLGQYASSYVLLGTGALALLWLLLHQGGPALRWTTAFTLTSYGFGAYTVLLGQLNEQFFVYVLPAAVVGTVLVAEAVLVRHGKGLRRALPALLAVVVVLSAASWVRLYTQDNDGMARLTRFVAQTQPPCAGVNVTGDTERFAQLLPGRPVTDYGTGPGALSHGITLFVLSDKDVALRYNNASPTLASWVRSHGSRLVAYPSVTYQGLELWRVDPDDHDPTAGVERYPRGDFVVTEGSRCGGFAVTDSAAGRFATAWRELGGKAVTGPPLSRSWTAGTTGFQVFTGAVVSSAPDAPPSTVPIVAQLSEVAPQAYRQAHLPPLAPEGADPAGLMADAAITATHQGDLARMLGAALGPPTRMADGYVRQAFAGGVLERPASSAQVRLAPVGRLAQSTGLVVPVGDAAAPLPAPPLPSDEATPQPTTVLPFVRTLAATLLAYGVVALVVLRGRRRSEVGAEAAPEPVAVPR